VTSRAAAFFRNANHLFMKVSEEKKEVDLSSLVRGIGAADRIKSEILAARDHFLAEKRPQEWRTSDALNA
jgi:hypothetical protein